MLVDDETAVGFFEDPKLFSIRTGEVLKRWETFKSGNQTSSINWGDVSIPPIAIDVPRRRFAVADDSGATVIDLTQTS
jgi:hypothetical protein